MLWRETDECRLLSHFRHWPHGSHVHVSRTSAKAKNQRFKGWEPLPKVINWKSTEHNIDLYVAFIRLFDITGQKVWRGRALHARRFVLSMWETEECGPEHFTSGTLADGVSPNCTFASADVNNRALLALGQPSKYGKAADWVIRNTTTMERCGPGLILYGTDFNDDRDGIWWEGTAHTAMAEQIRGRERSVRRLLTQIRRAQKSARRSNGLGIVAACHDGLSTGIAGFEYFNRLHIAATAWSALARLNVNPYWGTRIKVPSR